jgi:hypothetical protein
VYRENHYYGHLRVLRDYCGVSGRPIAGSYQHGWMPGTGIAGTPPRTRWSKFVWSRRNLESCRREGIAHVVPVGAPYLYLPDAPPASPARGEKSLLAFPFHGWQQEGVASVRESLEAYAQTLESLVSEGFGPVTVCLYHLEHERADLRAVFEQRGYDVVTAGPRDGNPDFLHTVRRHILDHGITTSNRIATATFYALHSGRPYFLHGPEPLLETEVTAGTGRIRAWETSEFPELLYERFDGTVHSAIGARELGADFRQSPDALARLLGWRGHGYLATLGLRIDVALWSAALRVARVLRRR